MNLDQLDYLKEQHLDECLDVWARYMNDSASVLRQELWFRDRSAGTYDKLNTDRNADESGNDGLIAVIFGAMENLSPDQRIAIDIDIGLRTVAGIQDPEARLREARKSISAVLERAGFM